MLGMIQMRWANIPRRDAIEQEYESKSTAFDKFQPLL